MTSGSCADLARRHDPDRFLLAQFERPDVREDLYALYAFNHEIAKTREVVTETQLGLIRLQWWREAVGAVYDGAVVPPHAVMTPLAEAIRRHNLPRDLFDNLVFAREFDLEDRLPQDIDGMLNYADFTTTPLTQLAMQISGGQGDARSVSIGYALTGLLRAVPFHAAQRRCYLPAALLAEAGISTGDLYEGRAIELLPQVVRQVAERTEQHLSNDAGFRSLRLMQKLALMYLRQIEGTGYDLFSARLSMPPFLRELRLLWASLPM